MPKNAACPRDGYPAKPPTRFQALDMVAYISTNTSRVKNQCASPKKGRTASAPKKTPPRTMLHRLTGHPGRPCRTAPAGRNSRTRIKMTKKVISDQAGDTVAATIADEVDTMTAAITAPPTLPRPPRTTIDSSREIRS